MDLTPAAQTSAEHAARVLLVDDDETLTFVLRAHLMSAGYQVEAVHTGEDAIAQASAWQPDVIVMDVTLPGIDGIAATREIKSQPATADVAVIMLTARSSSDHVVMALNAGAQEYVVKPFEVAELLARIRTVHRLRQTGRALDELNSRLATQVEERTARLRTLYNFTRSLNEAQTRDEILDLILTTVREVTGCQRVSILLAEDEGDHLSCARALGIKQSVIERIRVPVSEGIAGRVFSSGTTYVASTYAAENNARYESDSFVSTPLVATSLMTREERLGVLSITDKANGHSFTPDEVECIRSIADSGAIALNNLMRRERLRGSVNVLLMTVGRLAEFRDNETSLHLERVREYSRILAENLRDHTKYRDTIDNKFIYNLAQAAPMHDIGKVGVPDHILCKPDKLTAEEYGLMKEHCRIGREVLESAMAQTGPMPILQMCIEIAHCHHERYDGSGYPQGLSGEQIPLSARIIALVDAYDAISSKRRYKRAASHDDTVQIIHSEAGKHFDPDLVEVFMSCADQFDDVRRTHADEPKPAALAPV